MFKMWGGRFTKKTNPLVEEFTKSIQFDKKLAEYDCIGSRLHIMVLKKAGLLTSEEYKELEVGLKSIQQSIKDDSFVIDESFEDIHSYIQHLLEKKLGKVASKLHTCRSRNDQVVFDTKMYCKENLVYIGKLLVNAIDKLIKIGKKNLNLYMPGYTHLQHAMPVNLFYHVGTYIEMLSKDANRITNIARSIEVALGAGALAGTIIDSSKYNVAVEHFEAKAVTNPIYTVSDRDFIIEILSALSIIGMHLSRLAEDLILWSTKEFDFIDIDEAFCTGSSLMPQKKNPDVLELIRGNTGKLYGNLMSVLVMLKGLPLSYNRDMQLDKEPIFDSFEIVQKELRVLAELLPKIKFKRENIERQLKDECLYATDIVDYLVKEKKVPFKEAHTIIGKLVSYKLKTGKNIILKEPGVVNMKEEEIKKFHPGLNLKVMKKIINPAYSVKSKKSIRRKE